MRAPSENLLQCGLWNVLIRLVPSQRDAERYWPTWKAALLWSRAPHCLTRQMFRSVLAFFADAESASTSTAKIGVEVPSTSWIA